jgi:hypothetical protein
MAILTKLFKCGHTYYRGDDGVGYLADDSSAAVPIDMSQPIVVAADGIDIPLLTGHTTSATPEEAAKVAVEFNMPISIGDVHFFACAHEILPASVTPAEGLYDVVDVRCARCDASGSAPIRSGEPQLNEVQW